MNSVQTVTQHRPEQCTKQCTAPGSLPHVTTSLRCRDIKAIRNMSRHQLVSRHHSGVPRSRPPNGLATPFLLPSPKPGRTLCCDINFMSRPPGRPTYVVTSTPCRDILKTNLCRDIVFMSRPPKLMSMSRHQFHVATLSPA